MPIVDKLETIEILADFGITSGLAVIRPESANGADSAGEAAQFLDECV